MCVRAYTIVPCVGRKREEEEEEEEEEEKDSNTFIYIILWRQT